MTDWIRAPHDGLQWTRLTVNHWVLLACMALGACTSAPEKLEAEPLALMHRQAQTAYDQGDDAAALKLYKKLSLLSKQDAETWLRLGNLYARSNDALQAETAYRQALQINPSDARAWNNLGTVLLRQSWLAFVRAKQLAAPIDPAYVNSHDMIQVLERLPTISKEAAP